MEQLNYILNITWDIIKNWWWLLLPILLRRPFVFCWLWWRREQWMYAQKKVLLEIKMPKEIFKPLRSMEQAFSSIWGNLYDPPDRWEKWIDGKLMQTIQLEMVSLGGEPHLFIRVEQGRRNAVESSIYSQYPNAEITMVEDYTKYVPHDIPNKDWDMWGTDYRLNRPDFYPIKTYTKFFEEREAVKEEKRIDPMSTLFEGLGTFRPGEQLWIQIEAKPVASTKEWYDYDYLSFGRREVDKLARRPETPKRKSILEEAADELITGKMPGVEEKKEESIIPPEMKLTPGEREVVYNIEQKIGKRGFICFIRFIYLAKRDVYFGGGKAVPFGFFNQFATEDLNYLRPWTQTLTKIKKSLIFPPANLIRERRVYLRKRRLFFRYLNRFDPLFPKPSKEGCFLLNTEELATIFHFPGEAVASAPFIPRVEAKKGGAPSGLPVE